MTQSIPEFNVASFSQLHDVLARYSKTRWAFRGQSDSSWSLVPKVGRPPFAGVDENAIFRAWKRRAIELLELSPVDEWDWLAIAQHHGLATRLLDWTYNPLAAAFFAVEASSVTDANLYAFRAKWVVARDRAQKPLEYLGVTMFKPSSVARRISQQRGLFTVHGPPTIPLEESLRPGEKLERIVIARSYRKQLQFDLDHYGMNRACLFSDLDGVSAYVNWFVENRAYWAEPEEDEDEGDSGHSPAKPHAR